MLFEKIFKYRKIRKYHFGGRCTGIGYFRFSSSSQTFLFFFFQVTIKDFFLENTRERRVRTWRNYFLQNNTNIFLKFLRVFARKNYTNNQFKRVQRTRCGVKVDENNNITTFIYIWYIKLILCNVFTTRIIFIEQMSSVSLSSSQLIFVSNF